MQNCYYAGAGNGSLCYELYDKGRLAPDRQVLANVAEEMVQSMNTQYLQQVSQVKFKLSSTTLILDFK